MATGFDVDEYPGLVVDNGSGFCRAGFAGDDAPLVKFPSMVGRRRFESEALNPRKENYIGSDAQMFRDLLSLKYPISHGIVTDWDDMEKIWDYTVRTRLNVSPKERPILITEAPHNPKCNREKMVQVLFESFDFPGTYVASPGILSVYASGRSAAFIFDSGEGVTHTSFIYEGHTTPHAVNRLDLAGGDITEYLMKLLRERDYNFTTSSEREVVREIKENLCYVSRTPEENMKISSGLDKKFELPDGQVITVGDEVVRAPEILFQPHLIGMKSPGIHHMIYDTLMKCDIDMRRTLYCNIFVAGGTSLIPGIRDRLQKELELLIPSSMRIRVLARQERAYFPWIGGSIVASLSMFQNAWVTKEQYEEYGPSMIHRSYV